MLLICSWMLCKFVLFCRNAFLNLQVILCRTISDFLLAISVSGLLKVLSSFAVEVFCRLTFATFISIVCWIAIAILPCHLRMLHWTSILHQIITLFCSSGFDVLLTILFCEQDQQRCLVGSPCYRATRVMDFQILTSSPAKSADGGNCQSGMGDACDGAKVSAVPAVARGRGAVRRMSFSCPDLNYYRHKETPLTQMHFM
jgi:hypothetical protein